ncbi:MAG: putative metal-binding motif-containing protein [Bacteroidetes bacterium]|nr:putative metal-binding motif-containing protein [Bacteroidota bacterium]
MKHYITILFLSIVFSINNAKAQEPEIIWQNTYGGNGDDRARDILATDDGGYLTIGYSPSTDGDIPFNHGHIDMFVVKTDSIGNIQWCKAYGGSDYDNGTSACNALDGGFVLAGKAGTADGDISFNHGQDDIWIIKIGEDGNIEWEKTYGGSGIESCSKIIITTDGNYVVSGISNSNDGDVSLNKGEHDFWIIKLNYFGEILWEKTYGSSDTDVAWDIKQTSDNGYIVAGYTEGNDGDVTENKGGADYWIIKLDSTGELEWQKTYGGSSSDNAYSIIEKPLGGYLCVGTTFSSNGDVSGFHGFQDVWVLSLDSLGVLEWQKCYGGTGGEDGNLTIIVSGLDYIITGGSGTANGDVSNNNGVYDYWIIKIDSTGELIWEKSIGGSGSELSYAIAKTLDNHLILTGYSNSNDYDVTATYGTFNFWTVKLGICDIPFYADTDGDGFGDAMHDTLACVLPLGFVADSTDCNDADNTMYPTAIDICNGIDDNCNGIIDEDAVFIAYYIDADGDGFGNPETEELFCSFPFGYVTDSTDCDDTNENIYPGATEILNGLDDNCDGVIDEGLSVITLAQNTIKLFPNPANTEIHIEHSLHIISIITRNNLSETVTVKFINDIADISAIPPGVYFSEIRAEEGIVVVSWVKGD